MDTAIPWVIGLLVLSIIAVAVVIPTAYNAITTAPLVQTATGEVWNGTNGVVHSLANKPLISVTTFGLSTAASTYNDSSVTGNSSVNTTTSRIFTLLSPLDTGSVSGSHASIIVASSPGTGATVTVYANGALLGTTTGPTDTWSGLTVTSPLNVTLVRGGVNLSTVSNVTVNYYHFATSTAYSVTSTAAGALTPTTNGTFYTTYSYGSSNATSTQAILLLVPLMIGIVVLLLIVNSIPS